MDKIIGRDSQFAKFKSYESSGKSEFIALYGRRRVGKTSLIGRGTRRPKDCFPHSITETWLQRPGTSKLA